MDNGEHSYRRYLGGDDNGLAEIISLYNDGLVFFINGIVNNFSVADELSEAVFVKVGMNQPRRRKKTSLKAWIYTIGRNVALTYLKKASKVPYISTREYPERNGREILENRILQNKQTVLLYRAMKSLPAAYKQVLWLIYFEEFSAEETARIMKKSVYRIDTLVNRARQALKEELGRAGVSDETL